VENYSGCRGDAVKKVADAIASQFADGYAVAAVLAADWLKSRGCRGEEVEKAVKEAEGNVHRFVLHYLWYGLFNGNNAVSSRYAPLLLAVGFFGPHPPKLAKAVIRAFGGEPEEAVILWFSQPLHGTLYEAIEKVAHGAVYRQFGVGSDELCQGSTERPCRLVEICSEALVRVPLREYHSVEEVAVEYAKLIAEVFKAPRSAKMRPIDALVRDFLRAFNGVAEDGHWRIRYEIKGPKGINMVEYVIDELDVLSALYGLAVLPVWDIQLSKSLEDWFFVSGKKVATVGLYLYLLLRERGRKLVKRAAAIVREMKKRRGFYTDVDFLRTVGIVAAGQWDRTTDKDLEKAVKLVAFALYYFAAISPKFLEISRSLLSEAWRRVVSEGTYKDGGRLQRLADRLTVVAYSVAIGLLSLFFIPEKKELDPETVAQRFAVLYNAASNAGKLLLIKTLFSALNLYIGGVNFAALLLGDPQLEWWRVFEEVARRVEVFVSHLKGVERTYVMTHLYPPLAAWHASFGEIDKAAKFVDEALRGLEELWKTYEKDKSSMEKKLRPHLELRHIKPNLERELNELSLYAYHHVTLVYVIIDELNQAVKHAEETCELAKKHGEAYYEVMSCGLLLRLKAIRDGVPPVEEFEKVWQRASQAVERMGAEGIATAFGKYVVALAWERRFNDVEKVLEEWGWALELYYPDASALIYGVLSLFDDRYLEKAERGLPKWARADLPKLVDVLHDAVEAGLFANESERSESAKKKMLDIYGEDAVNALFKVVSTSSNLFLSALVGLAYCKRGEVWGLKLAKAAVRAGSGFKGITGRLFGELAKALESATVDKCITDEVLKAVYRLYYRHV